jgi:LEA14-like dessication related protein
MSLARPRLLLAPALLLVLALGGCAELQKIAAGAFERPRLTFRSASLQALDLEGATIGFTYDVQNPNSFGAKVARLSYGVEVEGTRVVTGEMPGGLTVPANGTAPMTFPVRVRFRDVPGIAALFGRRDAIAYRLSGTIGVETPLGVLDLPLSHEDRVTLPRLPDFAIEGLSIRNVSFTEIGLEVRVAVKNPNAFPIPAGSLDYALSLAGSSVARGDGRPTQVVPGRGKSVVAIPLTVNLAQVGRAAADLVRGGPVDVGLRGKADLAGIPLPLDLGARLPARR